MCARFELNSKGCKPGAIVAARAANGIVRHPWAGFARQEILEWWTRRGAAPVDIYANRFAERSDTTGRLEWEDVPKGLVIRGVVDAQSGQPLIKVVTRPSSRSESERFDHGRMPVLEPPLFERIELPPETTAEPELF